MVLFLITWLIIGLIGAMIRLFDIVMKEGKITNHTLGVVLVLILMGPIGFVFILIVSEEKTIVSFKKKQ